jgi:hypothetical protein
MLLCQMCQEEGFKFSLDIRNNEAHPLDLADPGRLSVWSLIGLPFKDFTKMLLPLAILMSFILGHSLGDLELLCTWA